MMSASQGISDWVVFKEQRLLGWIGDFVTKNGASDRANGKIILLSAL
jgi:hypothetical protein